MRAALALVALTLAACGPRGPEGIDQTLLYESVSGAIGDSNTCVILAKAGSGDVVWRYGSHMTCSRALPACAGMGRVTSEQLAKQAAEGTERSISCPTTDGGAYNTGWAAGPVPASEGKAASGLVYVANMEGERALPGREIKLRLESALRKAGF